MKKKDFPVLGLLSIATPILVFTIAFIWVITDKSYMGLARLADGFGITFLGLCSSLILATVSLASDKEGKKWMPITGIIISIILFLLPAELFFHKFQLIRHLPSIVILVMCLYYFFKHRCTTSLVLLIGKLAEIVCIFCTVYFHFKQINYEYIVKLMNINRLTIPITYKSITIHPRFRNANHKSPKKK